MKTVATTTTLHKASSLLLLALVVVAIALVAWPIIGSLSAMHEDIAAERARLANLRAKRVDLKSIEGELEVERSEATGRNPLILDVTGSAAAWERMERLLREIAARSGATVVSVRGLPLENEVDLKAARMELMLRTSHEGIRPLIENIEAARPLVFIETITMRGRAAAGVPDRETIDVKATTRVLATISPVQVPRR
ncbi:type II secretion system protein GspM [Methylorubrum thiocyanatum]|uniref:type II secretion system protein GspM n=1 Tax=Methylorubrum thiocyanatum TaxID=47958 RepID=UPI003F81E65F